MRNFKAMFLFFLSCFLMMSCLYAQNFASCGNNQYAQLGDTMISVLQKCGKPDHRGTEFSKPIKTRIIQRWTYNYPPNSGWMPNQDGQKLSFLKNALVVDLYQGIIVFIKVQGKSVKSTYYCQTGKEGKAIKIGDSGKSLYQLCQWPSITKNISEPISTKTTNQVVFTYNQSSYFPSVKLYFNNFKLVKIASS